MSVDPVEALLVSRRGPLRPEVQRTLCGEAVPRGHRRAAGAGVCARRVQMCPPPTPLHPTTPHLGASARPARGGSEKRQMLTLSPSPEALRSLSLAE